MSLTQYDARQFPYAKLTLKQAAQTLGISGNRIRRAIVAGELSAETAIARIQMVDALELAAWFEARQGRR